MRSRLLLSVILSLFLLLSVKAQIPQGFNYQAVAIDDSGMPLNSASLQVRLSILSDTVSNVVVWEELHNPVITSPSGIFSLVAGTGERQVSSQVLAFSDIDWGVPALFLRTSVYYLNQWRPMGTSRLWSVPYAMTAGDLTGSLKRLAVTGEATVDDEALFEVKNKNGQTVFAVYNEGVRVNVGSGETKAAKGGFAIGSFDESKGVRDYFVVNSDCVRVYLDNPVAGKAVKGGFAIGSFDAAKAGVDEYLRVTRDSTRVYVSNSGTKASKGGFAIGSFDEAKAGKVESFMNLTTENYLIGHLAGTSLTTGRFNSFFGYESGSMTTSGSNNSFMGYYAGRANTIGSKNVFIGNASGRSNSSGYSNVFIGDSVGVANTYGNRNIYIGNLAGRSNTSGSSNIVIGYQAGMAGTSGGQNVIIGNYAGKNNSGSQGLFIGEYAGESNTTGQRNSFVGFFAGQMNSTGEQNTYIGQFAGMNSNASRNTYVGYWAGGDNTAGQYNATLGWRAGRAVNGGSNNVYLGYTAGEYNTGSGNVFVGHAAGFNTGSVSNTLYISNASGTPLIQGDFSGKSVTTNGRHFVSGNYTSWLTEISNDGNTTSRYGLKIQAGTDDASGTNYMIGFYDGDGTYEGAITLVNGTVSLINASDKRLKINIVNSEAEAVDLITRLRVADYSFIASPEAKHTGFIAQEVQSVFPEMVVYHEESDTYGVDMLKLVPILSKAVQEQQKVIDYQNQEIARLRTEFEEIKAILKNNVSK